MKRAVSIEHVSKDYRIQSADMKSYRTFREDLMNLPRYLSQSLMGKKRELHHALQDVSLEIGVGERVGIIGRNGAGKSTLLKILSKVTRPTNGRVRIRGRVGSLLEVGTGFHGELTGRENIELSGAILGMTRAEIRRKFDEIIAFSGIEEYLDTPVKRYSSGMYTRLAFAVAANLETDILIVDEVLAVGDAVFQKKCMGKMNEVTENARTVLLVSHNMAAVNSVCSKSVWLDQGRVKAIGPSREVTERYISESFGAQTFFEGNTTSPNFLQIREIVLLDERGLPASEYSCGSSLTVRIRYFAPRKYLSPRFVVSVRSETAVAFTANMLIDGRSPEFIEGEGTIDCTFPSLPLMPQAYFVSFGVRSNDNVTNLTPSQDVGIFHVTGKLSELGFWGVGADEIVHAMPPVNVPYTWTLPNGELQSCRLLSSKSTRNENGSDYSFSG